MKHNYYKKTAKYLFLAILFASHFINAEEVILKEGYINPAVGVNKDGNVVFVVMNKSDGKQSICLLGKYNAEHNKIENLIETDTSASYNPGIAITDDNLIIRGGNFRNKCGYGIGDIDSETGKITWNKVIKKGYGNNQQFNLASDNKSIVALTKLNESSHYRRGKINDDKNSINLSDDSYEIKNCMTYGMTIITSKDGDLENDKVLFVYRLRQNSSSLKYKIGTLNEDGKIIDWKTENETLLPFDEVYDNEFRSFKEGMDITYHQEEEIIYFVFARKKDNKGHIHYMTAKLNDDNTLEIKDELQKIKDDKGEYLLGNSPRVTAIPSSPIPRVILTYYHCDMNKSGVVYYFIKDIETNEVNI